MSAARSARVAAQLRSALSELIGAEVRDPRVAAAGLCTIGSVELNRDMSVARVYVSFFGGEPGAADDALAILHKAAGALRGKVGRSLGLKRAPELRFYADPSAEMGVKLREIALDDEARHRDDDSE